MPPAYVFICTEAGGKWSAKQTNGEKALTAEGDSRDAVEKALVELCKGEAGDLASALKISHSQVTPSTTVFAATIGGIGGGGGGGAAPAAAAGGAPAAEKAPEPEPEPEEEEEEEEDMDFDLFD